MLETKLTAFCIVIFTAQHSESVQTSLSLRDENSSLFLGLLEKKANDIFSLLRSYLVW